MRAVEEPPRGPDLSLLRIVRWVARIAGSLLVLMVIFFVIGEGPPNPLKMSAIEAVALLALLVMVVGLVLAWWREGLGGGLTVGGFVAFWLLDLLSSHRFWPHGAFPEFLIVGLLYLFYWRLAIRARKLDS